MDSTPVALALSSRDQPAATPSSSSATIAHHDINNNIGAITMFTVRGECMAYVAQTHRDRVILTRMSQLLRALCCHVSVFKIYNQPCCASSPIDRFVVYEHIHPVSLPSLPSTTRTDTTTNQTAPLSLACGAQPLYYSFQQSRRTHLLLNAEAFLARILNLLIFQHAEWRNMQFVNAILVPGYAAIISYVMGRTDEIPQMGLYISSSWTQNPVEFINMLETPYLDFNTDSPMWAAHQAEEVILGVDTLTTEYSGQNDVSSSNNNHQQTHPDCVHRPRYVAFLTTSAIQLRREGRCHFNAPTTTESRCGTKKRQRDEQEGLDSSNVSIQNPSIVSLKTEMTGSNIAAAVVVIDSTHDDNNTHDPSTRPLKRMKQADDCTE